MDVESHEHRPAQSKVVYHPEHLYIRAVRHTLADANLRTVYKSKTPVNAGGNSLTNKLKTRPNSDDTGGHVVNVSAIRSVVQMRSLVGGVMDSRLLGPSNGRDPVADDLNDRSKTDIPPTTGPNNHANSSTSPVGGPAPTRDNRNMASVDNTRVSSNNKFRKMHRSGDATTTLPPENHDNSCG